MSVYISHTSALRFWSSFETSTPLLAQIMQPRHSPSWRTRAPLPSSSKATSQDIRRLSELDVGGLSYPVHILASSERARSRHSKAVCHVCAGSFPRSSFVRIDKGIYASSPELCFVQMALDLPFAALVRLGFELCGTYGIPTVAKPDYRFSVPFTTVARLERFVDAATGMPGARTARAALQHLVSGSASAMETTLTMLLCLPFRLGGYGLPKPLMNNRVDPKGRTRFAAEERCYYCDLLWPDIGMALEYDSSQFHGAKTSAADAKRRTDLLNRGIVVISVTNRSVRNLIELDGIARALGKKLGTRRRCDEDAWRARQHDLHGMLLESAFLTVRD